MLGVVSEHGRGGVGDGGINGHGLIFARCGHVDVSMAVAMTIVAMASDKCWFACATMIDVRNITSEEGA